MTLCDPLIASLRDDPRYLRLPQTTGLIRYWQTTRSKPDLCAAAGAPGFFRSL